MNSRLSSFLRTPSLVARAAAAGLFLLLGLAAACGGKQLGASENSGTGGSGGSGQGGSGGSGGGYNELDGATCVDIAASSFDLSCNSDSDCVSVPGFGQLCDGYYPMCALGTLNASSLSSYQSLLTPLTPATVYDCPEGTPTCVKHVCTICAPGPGGALTCEDETSDGGGGSDGTTGSDGGECVYIDLASYDQSCKSASDCVGIQIGEVCSGSCNCGGSLINQSGLARYENATRGIKFDDCPCAADGLPQCVEGKCTLCSLVDAAPGCPEDGG
jgi:hypothetical protein